MAAIGVRGDATRRVVLCAPELPFGRHVRGPRDAITSVSRPYTSASRPNSRLDVSASVSQPLAASVSRPKADWT